MKEDLFFIPRIHRRKGTLSREGCKGFLPRKYTIRISNIVNERHLSPSTKGTHLVINIHHTLDKIENYEYGHLVVLRNHANLSFFATSEANKRERHFGQRYYKKRKHNCG